ncbi:protein translocase SEC61 complex subunit gamma [Candidatus Woesearchaeota archaeon]|nr:protein translocase SEC61 complex subunit gamma [Candidatus Woesearchaeota archaeon]
MALKERLKTFIQECIRVFRITRKPTGDELKIIVKVSGIGILVIGLIGFTVNIIWEIIA